MAAELICMCYSFEQGSPKCTEYSLLGSLILRRAHNYCGQSTYCISAIVLKEPQFLRFGWKMRDLAWQSYVLYLIGRWDEPPLVICVSPKERVAPPLNWWFASHTSWYSRTGTEFCKLLMRMETKPLSIMSTYSGSFLRQNYLLRGEKWLSWSPNCATKSLLMIFGSFTTQVQLFSLRMTVDGERIKWKGLSQDHVSVVTQCSYTAYTLTGKQVGNGSLHSTKYFPYSHTLQKDQLRISSLSRNGISRTLSVWKMNSLNEGSLSGSIARR